MTSARSSDNGPRFLSELLRDMAHLRRQQEGTEKKLAELNREHSRCQKRLDALEAVLQGVKDREGKITDDIAEAEGRRVGQEKLLGLLAGPAVLIAAWFLSLTWFAIQHAQRDEADRQQRLRERPPQTRPPNPPQQNKP